MDYHANHTSALSILILVRDEIIFKDFQKTPLVVSGVFIFVPFWRDARVAEWDGLENRYTRKGIEGSNPSLSASILGYI